MTYRRGHHSTSDDATRYRDVAQQNWWLEHDNPIKRLRMFMRARGWWSEDQEAALREELRGSVLRALERVDSVPKPAVAEMFNDVYAEKTPLLLEQERHMQQHLARHPDAYKKGNYVDLK